MDRIFFLLFGSGRSRRISCAAALLLLVGTGCSLGPSLADRSFEAGDYREAAQKYEAYLQNHPDGPGRERALFRLTLLYSSPDTPVHDKERGESLRVQLVEQYPGGPYGSWVSWQAFLEGRVGVLRQSLEAKEAHIEKLRAELEIAQRESVESQILLKALEEELEERLAEMRVLAKRLEVARNEATTQKERMERLTEALELLKTIDLKETP